MIFAIGGFNGVTTIYNVECFDPSSDEWYVIVFLEESDNTAGIYPINLYVYIEMK